MNLDTLWLGSLGLALAMLLRQPLRRLFGPTATFGLWALVPCMCLVSLFPRVVDHPLPVVHAALDVPVPMIAAQRSLGLEGAWMPWAAGTVAYLVWLGVAFRRSRRGAVPMAAPEGTSDPHASVRFMRTTDIGPALSCGWPPAVLLPADFETRFDAREQQLAVTHEIAHVHRLDHLWTLLAHVMLALFWFNLLAWLAMPRFRLDMELACDAVVLRRHPGERSAYARALARQTDARAFALTTPWLAEPHLKERIAMINQPRTHRTLSSLAVATLLIACTGAAFAARSTDTPASSDLAIQAKSPPPYPAQMLKDKKEGTVVLEVEVRKDGSAGKIRVVQTPTQEFADASVLAARQWHFNPATKDGKAVDGYVRVPIEFSLTPKDKS